MGAERRHQAALLGERDEHRGRDRAAGRMRPARQGLDADDLQRARIQLRLIVQLHLAAFDRLLQFAFQPAAIDRDIAECGVEKPPGLPLLLGGGHRQFGETQDFRRIAGVERNPRQTDMRGQPDLGAADVERQAQCLQHGLGVPLAMVGIDHARQQRDELIGGEPRERDVFRRPPFELAERRHAPVELLDLAIEADLGDPAADILQQLVAGAIAERVVDLLKTLQIDEDRGARHVGGDQAFQHVGHHRAIGQPGERVAVRQPC